MGVISVETGDVLTTTCDVLVLKYAQAFFGVDRAVAKALDLSEHLHNELAPGKYLLIPTQARVAAKRVLFVGVPRLWQFGYAEIRKLAKDALTIVAAQDCDRDSIAFTMHGVGYGLDEREAFTAQIAGLLEYLVTAGAGRRPKHIAIVERDTGRAGRMKALLNTILAEAGMTSERTAEGRTKAIIPDAGIASEHKQHVFVAMPYDEEMEDVYELGIQPVVNGAGCLCERCDRSAFTGDVLDRIKHNISSATVVVADVTGANPNVYLEVGYAWGKSVPTLLLAKKGVELEFDARTQRCVFYTNITNLRKQLTELLPQVISSASAARTSPGGKH